MSRIKRHGYLICRGKVCGVSTGHIKQIDCLHCINALSRIAVNPVALKELHERKLELWYQRKNPGLMSAIAMMQKNGVLRAAA